MLLTITYTGHDTPDLGYLLYKNPSRAQVFDLAFGRARVFYPEVSDQRTTATLLLDIDPVTLTRGRQGKGLFDYVNDRPYVSSSFMSVALAKVFGTAMTGRADAHQELSDSPLDLTATVTMLPCRTDPSLLRDVFEPLGYEVSYETFILDESFPDWGDSPYVNLTLTGKVRLRDLLSHLYVLIPVFDKQKHYWIGQAEVDKLLRFGADWLPRHPARDFIASRYLGHFRELTTEAIRRLDAEIAPASDTDSDDDATPNPQTALNPQRMAAVVEALKQSGARSVIDLGCGEGNLLQLLLADGQFTRITGMDVQVRALRRASARLRLEEAGDAKRERVTLFQGSLAYTDARLKGYDAAAVVEVIEHMDLGRLPAFEQAVFQVAHPKTVVLTTPNREYNAKYQHLHDGLRHHDHRFEWTRAEFARWAGATAAKYGYEVDVHPVGEQDELAGAPTQMAVFTCA